MEEKILEKRGDDEIDIAASMNGVFWFLVERRVRILKVMSLVVLAALVYCLTATHIYRSSSKVVLPIQTSNTQFMETVSKLAGMSGSLSGSSGIDNIDFYIGIIKSVNMVTHLIDKFDLTGHYGLQNTPLDRDGLKKDIGKSIFVEGIDGGFLAVSVETDSPELSMRMVYEVILNTNDLINRMNITKAQEQKAFLAKRIEEASAKLASLEDEAKRFYLENNIFEIESQSRKTIEILSELLKKMLDLKTSILLKKISIGEDNPEFKVDALHLEQVCKQYDDIVRNDAGRPSDSYYPLIPMRRIPEYSFGVMRLNREIDMQKQLMVLLNQQYELASIDEKKESLYIRMLDEPELPVRKTRPKRIYIMLLSLVFGLIIGSLCAVITDLRARGAERGSGTAARHE